MSDTSASGPWSAEKLHLIDVGGAGGLPRKWLTHADKILPILFEPNPNEAAKLRVILNEQFGSGVVVESALSDLAGEMDLNITKYWGCTSLLEPNFDILSKYRIGPAFRVVDTARVTCVRYDTLFDEKTVPFPDAIKIDVQGYEYEVLQGFGRLLQTCLAIEVETHVYPIYKGQKLMHHLIALLADFGFVLRNTRPVANFDGDVVELDAWFTKDIVHWRTLEPTEQAKFSLICSVWGLVDYKRVTVGKAHNHLEPP